MPCTVPSAARALTFVFGVGTRVPPGRIAARSFPPLSSMLNGPYACFPAYASSPPLNVFLTAHTPLGLWTAIQPLLLPLRKEVIQPHLPIRLPCYDFTPVTGPAFGCPVLPVRSQTSGIPGSHGVTGGVYKTRERIHPDMLIRDY